MKIIINARLDRVTSIASTISTDYTKEIHGMVSTAWLHILC